MYRKSRERSSLPVVEGAASSSRRSSASNLDIFSAAEQSDAPVNILLFDTSDRN